MRISSGAIQRAVYVEGRFLAGGFLAGGHEPACWEFDAGRTPGDRGGGPGRAGGAAGAAVEDGERTDCFLQRAVIGAKVLRPTKAMKAAEVDLLFSVSSEYDASL